MEVSHLTKTGIIISAPKLSRELNKLLQWETYNPLPKLNKNCLTIIKIAFYALCKGFVWKTRWSKQLKIAVLNRQRWRFRAENNVLSAKVSELSEMIYCNHGPKKRPCKWKLYILPRRESCFRRSSYRDEPNNLLQWETYNLLSKWIKTVLQSSKSRFQRSWSDLSVKTCSNQQLKIAVLNRQQQRFRPENNLLSAKVIQLSEIIYCNNGPERNIVNGNLTSYQDGNHIFGAQTIEMSEITCCNEKPITFFQTELKRSYNRQNRVLRVLEAIWA